MTGIAFAQTSPGFGGAGQMLNFLPLVLVFAVFYFLLIRPQQKKAKEHQQMLGRLKRNDEVMTSGGIYGSIAGFRGDIVQVQIASQVKVDIARSAITGVQSEGEDAAAQDKGSKGKK